MTPKWGRRTQQQERNECVEQRRQAKSDRHSQDTVLLPH